MVSSSFPPSASINSDTRNLIQPTQEWFLKYLDAQIGKWEKERDNRTEWEDYEAEIGEERIEASDEILSEKRGDKVIVESERETAEIKEEDSHKQNENEMQDENMQEGNMQEKNAEKTLQIQKENSSENPLPLRKPSVSSSKTSSQNSPPRHAPSLVPSFYNKHTVSSSLKSAHQRVKAGLLPVSDNSREFEKIQERPQNVNPSNVTSDFTTTSNSSDFTINSVVVDGTRSPVESILHNNGVSSLAQNQFSNSQNHCPNSSAVKISSWFSKSHLNPDFPNHASSSSQQNSQNSRDRRENSIVSDLFQQLEFSKKNLSPTRQSFACLLSILPGNREIIRENSRSFILRSSFSGQLRGKKSTLSSTSSTSHPRQQGENCPTRNQFQNILQKVVYMKYDVPTSYLSSRQICQVLLKSSPISFSAGSKAPPLNIPFTNGGIGRNSTNSRNKSKTQGIQGISQGSKKRGGGCGIGTFHSFPPNSSQQNANPSKSSNFLHQKAFRFLELLSKNEFSRVSSLIKERAFPGNWADTCRLVVKERRSEGLYRRENLRDQIQGEDHHGSKLGSELHNLLERFRQQVEILMVSDFSSLQQVPEAEEMPNQLESCKEQFYHLLSTNGWDRKRKSDDFFSSSFSLSPLGQGLGSGPGCLANIANSNSKKISAWDREKNNMMAGGPKEPKN